MSVEDPPGIADRGPLLHGEGARGHLPHGDGVEEVDLTCARKVDPHAVERAAVERERLEPFAQERRDRCREHEGEDEAVVLRAGHLEHDDDCGEGRPGNGGEHRSHAHDGECTGADEGDVPELPCELAERRPERAADEEGGHERSGTAARGVREGGCDGFEDGQREERRPGEEMGLPELEHLAQQLLAGAEDVGSAVAGEEGDLDEAEHGDHDAEHHGAEPAAEPAPEDGCAVEDAEVRDGEGDHQERQQQVDGEVPPVAEFEGGRSEDRFFEAELGGEFGGGDGSGDGCDDDRRHVPHGEGAEDHLEGEEHAGDRRVERCPDPCSRTCRNEAPEGVLAHVETPGDRGADGRPDLHDRPLSTARPASAQGERRGNRLDGDGEG